MGLCSIPGQLAPGFMPGSSMPSTIWIQHDCSLELVPVGTSKANLTHVHLRLYLAMCGLYEIAHLCFSNPLLMILGLASGHGWLLHAESRSNQGGANGLAALANVAVPITIYHDILNAISWLQ